MPCSKEGMIEEETTLTRSDSDDSAVFVSIETESGTKGWLILLCGMDIL